jgi:PAS domain S-box-containing protein
MAEESPRDAGERLRAQLDAGRLGAVDDITAAWQKARDAFEESERRYRDLVEHSLGLICTHDLSGRLLSINPAAARSLGYEPEFGVGRNLVEFLAPGTRHLFDAYLRRIRDNRQDAGLMRVVARDGTERFWTYRNVLHDTPGGEPYVLGHAIDITDRVRAERRLREKEQALQRARDELDLRVQERTIALELANERLRTEIAERQRAEESRERALIEQRDTLQFLAAMSEGLAPVLRFEALFDVVCTLAVPFAASWTMVHELTGDGTIRSRAGRHADDALMPELTRAAAAASGLLPPETLVACAIATGQRITATDRPEHLAPRVAGSEPAPFFQQMGIGSIALLPVVAPGQVVAAVSLGSASAGRFEGAGGMLVDEIARRLRLTLDRLHLYREAEDANRLKDEFLSTLSHELRTPLNAVFGWARILRKRQLDPKTSHAVEVIERNATAQLRLIEEVLDVSRIITGKMSLSMESLDIGTVLHAAVDAVRPALQAKGVRLEERLEPDVPAVIGDAHRLQQVFWNVLSNAVKFTGADGAITVVLRRANGSAEVAIRDTGVGIRRDVLPFVFDRFRQGDSSPSRSHGGIGLGLAIVRHIVELHGGTVKAESLGEGHGATFTVQLPAARRTAAAPVAAARATTADIERPAILRGKKVLVVEDHEDARELVASVLESAGAEVTTAGSTRDARRHLADARPDVLVADPGLPDEDGYALIKSIRAMESPTSDLPAVALTAYARASDRERALAAGFVAYLVKPVDPQELVRTIASVL